MFDKSRKYKTAGSIIIVALLLMYLIFNINIKSADSYKNEKDNSGYEKVTDELIADNQTEEGEVTATDISKNETENCSLENSKDNGESLELVTVQNTETSTQTVQSQTIQKETLQNQLPQNQTVEPSTQQIDNINDNTSKQITVSIEITCTSAVEKKPQIQNEGVKNSIPDDGIILKKTTYKVPENADVYTLLAKAAADNNIPIKANTNKTYVSSINNLAQMMLSQQSGWKYSVNGKVPSAAACDYKLSDGDTVKWFYVLSIYDGE